MSKSSTWVAALPGVTTATRAVGSASDEVVNRTGFVGYPKDPRRAERQSSANLPTCHPSGNQSGTSTERASSWTSSVGRTPLGLSMGLPPVTSWAATNGSWLVSSTTWFPFDTRKRPSPTSIRHERAAEAHASDRTSPAEKIRPQTTSPVKPSPGRIVNAPKVAAKAIRGEPIQRAPRGLGEMSFMVSLNRCPTNAYPRHPPRSTLRTRAGSTTRIGGSGSPDFAGRSTASDEPPSGQPCAATSFRRPRGAFPRIGQQLWLHQTRGLGPSLPVRHRRSQRQIGLPIAKHGLCRPCTRTTPTHSHRRQYLLALEPSCTHFGTCEPTCYSQNPKPAPASTTTCGGLSETLCKRIGLVGA